MDSLPLIGRPTLSNLGRVLIDETGNLTKPTEQETNKVKKTTTTQPKLREILKKYEERFQGIGKAKKRWTRHRNSFTNERERNADSSETKTSTVSFTRASGRAFKRIR